MKRYIVDVDGPIITAVNQYSGATEDNIRANQRIIYTDEPIEKLFSAVIVNGVLKFLGPRPPYSEISSETLDWEYRLGLQQQALLALNKSLRDLDEFSGFFWDGYFFDSDSLSQQRIQGAVQLALLASAAGQPFSITWTLANNASVTLDSSQMIAVGLALGAHIQATHERARLTRQAILAATSKPALDAISQDLEALSATLGQQPMEV